MPSEPFCSERERQKYHAAIVASLARELALAYGLPAADTMPPHLLRLLQRLDAVSRPGPDMVPALVAAS